jgi:hypothetical protein
MDRQILDLEGRLVGKVDDLELTLEPGQPPAVSAILTGPGAWGPRMSGLLGRLVTGLWRWLRTDRHPAPRRIDFSLVTHLDSAVTVQVPREQFIDGGVEQRLRAHVIEKLPGAHHDPE